MPNSSRISRPTEKYQSLDEVAHNMVSKPFADVAMCVAERKNKTIGPTLAHVVNFSPMPNQTQPQYWRRFLYPICTRQTNNGRRCGQSLEFGPRCGHHSFAVGTFTHVYRFEVFLIDAIYNGETSPMRCTISEGASVFLGVAATVFEQWTDDEQEDYLRDLIKQTPFCHFYFVVRDGDVTAHIMTMFEPVPRCDLPARLRRGTAAGPTLRRIKSCFARISVLRNTGKEIVEIVVESEPRPDSDDSPGINLRGSPPFSRAPSSQKLYSESGNRFVFVGSSSNPTPGQEIVARTVEEVPTADPVVASNFPPTWIRRIVEMDAALKCFERGYGHATPGQEIVGEVTTADQVLASNSSNSTPGQEIVARIVEEVPTADPVVASNSPPTWIRRIVRMDAALKCFGGGYRHATPGQEIVEEVTTADQVLASNPSNPTPGQEIVARIVEEVPTADPVVASNPPPRRIRRIVRMDALLKCFRRG